MQVQVLFPALSKSLGIIAISRLFLCPQQGERRFSRGGRTLRRGAVAKSRGFSRRASFDVSVFGGVRSFRLRAAYSLCASSRRLARRTRLICRSKSPLLISSVNTNCSNVGTLHE